LQEFKASEKIVQKMTRDGLTEINKATGDAERISAREQDTPAIDPKNGAGQITDRLKSEHRAAVKKRAVRKANEQIRSQMKGVPGGKPVTRPSRNANGSKTGKLKYAASRPAREISLAAHGKLLDTEKENTGVESAHAAERAAESAARTANRQLQKSIQKRKIKRDYANAFRQGNTQAVQKAADTVKKTAQKATKTAQKTAAFAARHWKEIGIVLAIAALIALLFSGLSSCGAMMQGGVQSMIATSFTAEDTDIIAVDENYSALETGLRQQIDNIERDYPNYDEYRYSLDEIGHDTLELASYLAVKLNSYTPVEAQAELQRLFGQQYTLTVTPLTETRYRTETRTGSYTDAYGNLYTYTYTVEVPYDWYVLKVTLVNHSLGSVALDNLTDDQAKLYRVYLETQGNKPELFVDNVYVRSDYTGYDIPPEALTDERFAAMIQEAEKYLGYPYVWGGSSPATSFDCSGFVCWVINHSGVGNVGRTTAQGLYNLCAHIPPGEAKPGDLIFFQGTYDSAGPVSHVGIYVGNGMMIAAGNPIKYTNITTSYWTSHFYAYGRLP